MPVFLNKQDAQIFIARYCCRLLDDCNIRDVPIVELAKKAGLKVRTLRAYQKGDFLPSIDIFNKIADVLNWPPVKLTTRLKINHCYIFHDTDNSIFTFRYEGLKDGLHSFREIHNNWIKSLSDTQLIGKFIQEVQS